MGINKKNMDGREFSTSQGYADPGPLAVSDLHNSAASSNTTKKRKEFRGQKPADYSRDSNKPRDGVPLEPPTEPYANSSTIEAPILNRLRNRLDPIYNPSTDMPPQAAVADSDSSAPPVDKPVKKTKKKRKGHKPRSAEEEATQDSMDQPVATVTVMSTDTTDKPVDNTSGWYTNTTRK